VSIKNVLSNLSRSNEKLEQARRYAKEAESLPEGDEKHKWLEEEAQRLISEARALTEEAKDQSSRSRYK